MVEPGGNSHADNHDRDKLRRWQSDLAAVAPDAPAVYAIFLVSEADKAAHDIFRTFRTSFEERFEDREAGFAHLVIFGQHGISATLRRIQAELDLLPEELPTLALFGGDAEDAEYITADVISLPRGGPSDSDSGSGSGTELREAYWWTTMYWSDSVLAGAIDNAASITTDVLAPLRDDPSDDKLEPEDLDLEQALLWAEAKMDESIAASGPPELNRVLRKRLSDLCKSVAESLGE